MVVRHGAWGLPGQGEGSLTAALLMVGCRLTLIVVRRIDIQIGRVDIRIRRLNLRRRWALLRL
ncbi:hypothetical protein BJY01DRAFT_225688 [Aspergillus pseudoustus]|uniref:Uncharacterized protein n=1 Tax=Aspergillus pseudoustus TaxID=1810923 RepID=A0ABR4IY90_9EURO